ncbi:MAG: phosphoribosylformylglycinamidine synthase subunit PurL [Synergistales bacterium]
MDYRKAGLRDVEIEIIRRELGREPNEAELRIFGVMWSEHCSYKSSRPLLSLFPKNGPAVLKGVGENAGVVDAGRGWGLAFKVESHNHPSAVEPYQGAATGVGGIIRDILAMGARPMASLDGLFFGKADSPKTRFLSDGIVKGVGGYGNCVGVPTVGGKTLYDERYEGNPLLNAFCMGLVASDSIVSSQTAEPGNLVVLLGSKTGRDGIGGAAFASAELGEDTKASRPQVQIGDPFVEKLLIEACLEALEKDLVASMQDMGAAGITSSASEIAAKSGVGMILDLDKVPLRETDMEAWEIALSESQERMLLIVRPEKLKSVLALGEKWDLDCAVIGETVEGDRFILEKGGRIRVDLPASLIGGGCPEIAWPVAKPKDLVNRQTFEFDEAELPKDLVLPLLKLLSSPSLREKSWITQQYDSMVQVNTVQGPGAPVSLVRIKENGNIAAMTMEALPWACYLDPYRGGYETMARSLRPLWITGARHLGMTNCLNFPSPENPEQYWEFQESVKGLAACCTDLLCPVVSGNVSLYNESAGLSILPTPLVCSVGLLDAGRKPLLPGNWKEGDHLFVAGIDNASIPGSHFQVNFLGRLNGRPLPPAPEMERDFMVRALLTSERNLADSANPLLGGGLGIALCKESILSGLGAEVLLDTPTHSVAAFFAEGGARALYAVPATKIPEFLQIWRGFPLRPIGVVGGSELRLPGSEPVPVQMISKAWKGA